MSVYDKLVKPVLFRMDPEFVHDRFVFAGRLYGSNFATRGALSLIYRYEHPALAQTIDGIRFSNPIGLAAGFDKNAQLMKVLPSMGFGFEEVGSITNEAYGGNPKPRLVRLPKDKSIIVYYGLKNKGADVLRKKFIRTEKGNGKKVQYKIPIGVSVAMTNKHHANDTKRIEDWVAGVKKMNNCGSYLTINASCPNTYDPRNFCDPFMLDKVLAGIKRAKLSFKHPVYVKLTADINTEQLDHIITVCDHYPFVKGFILTNLVKDRSTITFKSPKSAYTPYKGGVSGPFVRRKALQLVKHAYARAGDRYTIIACGGTFTAQDAYEYIRSGASLVQLVTGMVYGGPGTIKRINKGLVLLLRKDGYDNLTQARGVDVKTTWKKRK